MLTVELRGRQVARIVEWMGAILAPGQIVEVRALRPFASRTFATAEPGGLEKLAAFAAQHSGRSQGVYYTPNPLKSIRPSGKHGTAVDSDVLARNWLLIDADPKRPAATNATPTERVAALQVVQTVREALAGAGIGGTILIDSGNGSQLMVPVEWPNDDVTKDLHRQFLRYAEERHGTATVEIDSTTHNASRIWKLPGTLARKGAEDGERVHHFARILDLPENPRDYAASNVPKLAELVRIWRITSHLGPDLSAGSTGRPEDRATLIRRARLYLEREAPAIAGQKGSDVCYHVCGICHDGFGLEPQECLEALGDWNQRCVPVWSEKDLLHKIASVASKHGPRGELAARGRDAAPAAQPGPRQTVNGAEVRPPSAQPDPGPGAWEAPVELSQLPPAPPFPLDVLPEGLRAFVTEAAWATSSPIDYVAVPLLAFAAGAIGNSRWISVTRTHVQPPGSWAFIVGKSGTGKSPAFRLLKAPFTSAARQYLRDYKQDKIDWEAGGSRGPAPVLRRCMTDVVTPEKLLSLLNENPRGLIMAKGELAGLVSGMNQYREGGKGDERQIYLQLWDAESTSIDRKSNPDGFPLTVQRPLLSIVGTIQPSVVEKLRNDDNVNMDDGFLERFLCAYPVSKPADEERFRDVAEATSQVWDHAVRDLLAMKMEGEGDTLRPHFVRLSQTGCQAWVAFTRTHAAEVNSPLFSDHLASAWSKLRGYCLRLALVLHCLDRVVGGLENNEVDGLTVQRAARLIAYFKGQVQRVGSALDIDPRVGSARKVALWCRTWGKPSFSRRDLWRGIRRQFKKPEDLFEPLALLCQTHHLRPLGGDPRESVSRRGKDTERYEINPAVIGDNGDNLASDEAAGEAGNVVTTPPNSGVGGDNSSGEGPSCHQPIPGCQQEPLGANGNDTMTSGELSPMSPMSPLSEPVGNDDDELIVAEDDLTPPPDGT